MHIPIYKESLYYIFGILKFPSVARLLAHFDHHPIIAGPTGKIVTLPSDHTTIEYRFEMII